MKVILIERVKKVGDKYDVVDVADGYAHNYLIPQKLAKPATESNLKELKSAREEWERRSEEREKGFKKISEKLEGSEINLIEKVNEEGVLFGSIDGRRIKKELKKKGHDLEEAEIVIPEPIKEIGEWKVKINFPFDIESEIKVIVESE